METNNVHVVMTKNTERIFTLVPVNGEALLVRFFAYPAPHNPTESSDAGSYVAFNPASPGACVEFCIAAA